MNKILILKDIISSIKNYYSQNSKFAYCKTNIFNKKVVIVLLREGLITGVKEVSNREIKIGLKYFRDKPFINNIELIYKPSLKKSYTFNEINFYRKKYDIFFISTSNGLLSSNNLNQFYKKEQKIGGQLLFGIKLSK